MFYTFIVQRTFHLFNSVYLSKNLLFGFSELCRCLTCIHNIIHCYSCNLNFVK